jgi:hypothetical protein
MPVPLALLFAISTKRWSPNIRNVQPPVLSNQS